MSTVLKVNIANLELYKSEIIGLSDKYSISEKLNEIDNLLDKSCGNTASKLKEINEQFKEMEKNMQLLIITTAEMIQAVKDEFMNFDNSILS